MADFDAYYEWLGISPQHQPPNHYRLLGLDLFESNPSVIEHAADRQMRHVRTFHSGPNSQAATTILNELAAARLCLLNVEKKAAYDAQLQRAASPAGETAGSFTMAAPLGQSPEVPFPTDSSAAPLPRSVSVRDTAPGRRNQRPVAVEALKVGLGGLAGVALAVVILFYGFGVDLLGLSDEGAPIAQAPTPAASPVDDASRAPVQASAGADEPAAQRVVAKAETAITTPPASVPSRKTGTSPSPADSAPSTAVQPPAQKESWAERQVEVAEQPEQRPATPTATPPPVPASSESEPPDGARLAGVARQKLVPLQLREGMPPELEGGTKFTWAAKPTTDVANGVLEFTVEESGLVYIAATFPETDYQGNTGGDWYQQRVTREQLVQQGWDNLGRCPWNEKAFLFRKVCDAGDSHRIRTNKYWPPAIYLPPSSP